MDLFFLAMPSQAAQMVLPARDVVAQAAVLDTLNGIPAAERNAGGDIESFLVHSSPVLLKVTQMLPLEVACSIPGDYPIVMGKACDMLFKF